MGVQRASLASWLRVSRAWQWLIRVSPDQIDDALRYIEFLEETGAIDPGGAANWRWRVLACWAEQERRRKRARSAA